MNRCVFEHVIGNDVLQVAFVPMSATGRVVGIGWDERGLVVIAEDEAVFPSGSTRVAFLKAGEVIPDGEWRYVASFGFSGKPMVHCYQEVQSHGEQPEGGHRQLPRWIPRCLARRRARR